MISNSSGLYERIGREYGRARRPDPRIQARIAAALGEAASVVNVGAGTGSYEPADRRADHRRCGGGAFGGGGGGDPG